MSETVVLDQTFNDVDLVGRPLTIGNFVSAIRHQCHFYRRSRTPIRHTSKLGDEAFPRSERRSIIRGQDYQEVLTNFPFASSGPDRSVPEHDHGLPGLQPETVQKTLFDRIGYAARQGDVATNVSVEPGGRPWWVHST